MPIQIELSRETESRLRERAAAEGKHPATVVQEAVEEKLASGEGPSNQTSNEDRVAVWRRFVAAMHRHTRNLPPMHWVDDSRESIYGGCGE